MKALVIEKPNHAVIKEVPYPEPGPGELAVKVERVGICGTDFHIFAGTFLSPYPLIPGHEFSGVVDKVGEGVEGFVPGDRVTADPTLLCGECEYCLTRRGNQCLKWGALGDTTDGAMAEYVKLPARNAVKIPDTMSFAEAAFVEPVACVVHGMNRLDLKMGDRVILFGAGAMGLQLVQAIAAAGASELVVVDVSPNKLQLALGLGATRGVLSGELKPEDFPRGFDAVVDATGVPAVIERALGFLGPAGKFLQFGVAPQNAEIRINPFKLYHKDWTLIGSMAINHTFLPAFRWVKEKRIKLEPLVSKVITLEETPDFLARPKDPDLLKVQIQI
ncbi:theronine dehydrogenase-like Zn-dependent dehydrogenase [Thermobacillus composti KWC4]|uniref:Theronine dehydrogenase-like Zn-dependent dehydrogenase n=1 Tax=Thermobacillus composti (strain DSM 18247 / JCM 13945 / KWC4) TaxID=717605 RepID=L0EF06_THECK|nr:zinc-dependent alcohol dehydrogenase family protein [Thermobacillus composti]AGA58848.1 theronine dehydrogenase-like Zn-dependent dehydrogenase [Thermobacillus composti KWC4]